MSNSRINMPIIDCEISMALLKAVGELPRLSSNVLLQRIVRGVKFGNLTDAYLDSPYFGVLADKEAREVQIALDRLVFNGMLIRLSRGYSSACAVANEGRAYIMAQSQQRK